MDEIHKDFTYSSDKALSHFKDDSFSRAPFAKRIAEQIESFVNADSMVFGINGKWGEGKTSVLNFIEKYFEERNSSDILTIKFNPWLFSNEEEMLTNFFYLLADSLNKKLETKKELTGSLLDDYVKPIMGIASMFPGVPDIGNQLSSFFVKANINELKERIEKILLEEKKRIVLFIDDIDRLDKEEIYNIFRIVKLTADINYITYILSFDNDLVASALKDKYGSDNKQAGYEFLEKIVQVPLPLPKIEFSELRSFTMKQVEDVLYKAEITLTSQEVQEFITYFQGLEPFLDTPRSSILFSNIIHFSLPMLKNEVNIVDLLLVEGFKAFVPNLYKLIRNNKNLFLDNANKKYNEEEKKNELDKKKRIIEETIELYSENEQRGLIYIINHLFPAVEPAFEKFSIFRGDSLQWKKEQRVCSELYFNRYFLYTVSSSDIADVRVKGFISNLRNEDVDISAEEFASLIESSNDKLILNKIKNFIDTINSSQKKVLCKVLANTGHLMSNPNTFLGLDNPLRTTASTMVELIRTIENDEEKNELSQDIIIESSSPILATEYFRSLNIAGIREANDASDNVIDISALGALLSNQLVTELRTMLESDPKKISSSIDFPSLIYICKEYGQKSEPDSIIEEIIDEDKLYAIVLIESFLSTVYGNPSVTKGNVDKEVYKKIKSNVDINLIKSAIDDIYPIEDVDSMSFPENDNSRYSTVAQFLWQYEQDVE
ncbi:P-loop NTPase fold protein [uncultured Marinococcus sp.]|uniref:KAP family P-loop NTPase fold protein n=1 Tax=uncultured Marinococcus sp. TaxID=487012 RepID=UPI0026068F8D|nr:P-loop NTPase fold protein [uncultured Marinococcus sp.]